MRRGRQGKRNAVRGVIVVGRAPTGVIIISRYEVGAAAANEAAENNYILD